MFLFFSSVLPAKAKKLQCVDLLRGHDYSFNLKTSFTDPVANPLVIDELNDSGFFSSPLGGKVFLNPSLYLEIKKHLKGLNDNVPIKKINSWLNGHSRPFGAFWISDLLEWYRADYGYEITALTLTPEIDLRGVIGQRDRFFGAYSREQEIKDQSQRDFRDLLVPQPTERSDFPHLTRPSEASDLAFYSILREPIITKILEPHLSHLSETEFRKRVGFAAVYPDLLDLMVHHSPIEFGHKENTQISDGFYFAGEAKPIRLENTDLKAKLAIFTAFDLGSLDINIGYLHIDLDEDFWDHYNTIAPTTYEMNPDTFHIDGARHISKLVNAKWAEFLESKDIVFSESYTLQADDSSGDQLEFSLADNFLSVRLIAEFYLYLKATNLSE